MFRLTFWSRHSQSVRIETSKKKGEKNLAFDADDDADAKDNNVGNGNDANDMNDMNDASQEDIVTRQEEEGLHKVVDLVI